MVWQIAAATGWTPRQILWGVNYQTLRMMLADAPHYETHHPPHKEETKGRKAGRTKHPRSTAGFFQSLLNRK